MKIVIRVLLIVIAVVILAIGGGILYVMTAKPDVEQVKSANIKTDSLTIARGKYLAENVATCSDCHSPRDFTKFSGPIIPGKEYSGNTEDFTESRGFPGNYYAANLTPANLSRYSDDELLHTIATGVNLEGEPLFPVMPYLKYRHAAKEDLEAIIAYLRTLEPIESEVPESEPSFPMNIINRMIPKSAEFGQIPDKSDKVAYGRYMANLAACSDCHTPMNKGRAIKGMEFAGGREFPMPSGAVLRSHNLTPDRSTGIGTWPEKMFVRTFKQYADSNYVPQHVKLGEFNTVMPWMAYSGMSEEDLKAIYVFLMSLEPIENYVSRWSTPAEVAAMNK